MKMLVVPMTPFPIPLTTPPDTSINLVMVWSRQEDGWWMRLGSFQAAESSKPIS